jgi:hypothetical protein
MTIFRACILLVSFTLALDIAGAQIAKRIMRDWHMPMPANNFRVVSHIYHHGLRPLVDVAHRAGGQNYRVVSNSLGMIDGQRRTIDLNSDSFTEGYGVGWTASFAGLLAERWKDADIEVLNAGVSSYSPTIYYRRIKHLIEAERVEFDALFVAIDITDAVDDQLNYDLDDAERVVQVSDDYYPPLRDPTLKDRIAFALVDNSLTAHLIYLAILRTRFIPSYAAVDPLRIPLMDLRKDRKRTDLQWIFDDPSDLLEPLTVKGKYTSRRLGPWASKYGYWMLDRDDWMEFGKLGLRTGAERMDRLLKLLRQHNIPLTISVHPWQSILFAGEREPVNVKFWRGWAERRGVGFINLFPAFFNAGPAAAETHFLAGDFHWNSRGHALVADEISRVYNPRKHCRPR